MTLGVRPEDLRIASGASAAGAPSITATVDVVEPLGNEAFLHLRAGERALVARVDADSSVRVGDRVTLSLDPRKLHFFDADDGRALRPFTAARAT